jgi:hypothetical protein
MTGKRRRPLFSAIAFGCAVLTACPSWAAVVQPGVGDLTINQGKGFKPVTSGATANVGDSVMVGPGGSATITYDDGCKVDVQPGAVATIAPLSPCASGSNAQGPPPGTAYNPTGCKVGPNGVLYDCDPGWQWAVGLTLAVVVAIIAALRASQGNGTVTPVQQCLSNC